MQLYCQQRRDLLHPHSYSPLIAVYKGYIPPDYGTHFWVHPFSCVTCSLVDPCGTGYIVAGLGGQPIGNERKRPLLYYGISYPNKCQVAFGYGTLVKLGVGCPLGGIMFAGGGGGVHSDMCDSRGCMFEPNNVSRPGLNFWRAI